LVQSDNKVNKDLKDNQDLMAHLVPRVRLEVQDPLEHLDSTVPLVRPVLLALPDHLELQERQVFLDHLVLKDLKDLLVLLELLEHLVFLETKDHPAQTVSLDHRECPGSLALLVLPERQDRLAQLEILGRKALRDLKACPVSKELRVTLDRLDQLAILAHLVRVVRPELMVCLEILDLLVPQGLLVLKDLLGRRAAPGQLDRQETQGHRDSLDSLEHLEVQGPQELLAAQDRQATRAHRAPMVLQAHPAPRVRMELKGHRVLPGMQVHLDLLDPLGQRVLMGQPVRWEIQATRAILAV